MAICDHKVKFSMLQLNLTFLDDKDFFGNSQTLLNIDRHAR